MNIIGKQYRSSTDHACRHLTASCRTALLGSSRAFDIAFSTWKSHIVKTHSFDDKLIVKLFFFLVDKEMNH